ncbi:snoal-like polyketide cyclase family protein [Lasiodiplodia theobromae]|uniref:snoal-like polyketide cyclase family protein n=1 Tax=Lasiodiplodia theobromae TaxID=45133 RepID=UPI0015C35F6F|nr:snoal-like polyketide cyclase family protein [Lasiodiplodia theobromae]KAF4536870.1 snoal-like polyketide cyclase family protein [Lasiodiplodia theobromae]
MQISTSTILCTLAGFLARTASAALIAQCDPIPNCPPHPTTIEQQRAVFTDFINMIYKGGNVTEAYLTYVSEDYIQHNPSVLSGRQNAIDAVQGFIDTGATFDVMHTAFDDGYGYVFSRVDFGGTAQPAAVVDVLRLNGSCIVEHWDVMQVKPANATNPLAMWS